MNKTSIPPRPSSLCFLQRLGRPLPQVAGPEERHPHLLALPGPGASTMGGCRGQGEGRQRNPWPPPGTLPLTAVKGRGEALRCHGKMWRWTVAMDSGNATVHRHWREASGKASHLNAVDGFTGIKDLHENLSSHHTSLSWPRSTAARRAWRLWPPPRSNPPPPTRSWWRSART